MVQFVMLFFHALNALVNPICKWPLLLSLLELCHAVLFFYLFYSFYRIAYAKKPQSAKEVNNNLLRNTKEIKAN